MVMAGIVKMLLKQGKSSEYRASAPGFDVPIMRIEGRESGAW